VEGWPSPERVFRPIGALQLAAGRPSQSRSIIARKGLALKVAAPGAVEASDAWASAAQGAADSPTPASVALG